MKKCALKRASVKLRSPDFPSSFTKNKEEFNFAYQCKT